METRWGSKTVELRYLDLGLAVMLANLTQKDSARVVDWGGKRRKSNLMSIKVYHIANHPNTF